MARRQVLTLVHSLNIKNVLRGTIPDSPRALPALAVHIIRTGYGLFQGQAPANRRADLLIVSTEH